MVLRSNFSLHNSDITKGWELEATLFIITTFISYFISENIKSTLHNYLNVECRVLSLRLLDRSGDVLTLPLNSGSLRVFHLSY